MTPPDWLTDVRRCFSSHKLSVDWISSGWNFCCSFCFLYLWSYAFFIRWLVGSIWKAGRMWDISLTYRNLQPVAWFLMRHKMLCSPGNFIGLVNFFRGAFIYSSFFFNEKINNIKESAKFYFMYLNYYKLWTNL